MCGCLCSRLEYNLSVSALHLVLVYGSFFTLLLVCLTQFQSNLHSVNLLLLTIHATNIIKISVMFVNVLVIDSEKNPINLRMLEAVILIHPDDSNLLIPFSKKIYSDFLH